jgi:hypothetical protein
VEWRRDIGAGIAASAIAHLSIVALLLLFAEVHPFGATLTEPIAVDLVTAAEADRKVEPTPTPTPVPQLPLPDKPAAAPVTADLPKQAAAPVTPQAAPPEPPPRPVSAPPEQASPQGTRPNPGPPPRTPPAAPSSAALGYTPPEPDLTVKYHVLLGLPGDLPPPSSPVGKPGDGIDATASTAADVDSSLVAEFRRRLKTCSKLPASIAPSENVMIKLRVLMASDGTLAAEPILIEATASEKGPLLMQAAIRALQSCQPYAMLPRDRYGEWKVIDLPFTPHDFLG